MTHDKSIEEYDGPEYQVVTQPEDLKYFDNVVKREYMTLDKLKLSYLKRALNKECFEVDSIFLGHTFKTEVVPLELSLETLSKAYKIGIALGEQSMKERAAKAAESMMGDRNAGLAKRIAKAIRAL